MASNQTQEAQYFKPNQGLLPAGPARVAEADAVRKRQLAYQRVVSMSREFKDALLLGQSMDNTGNFDAALDHGLRVWETLQSAMEDYRVQGITFLAAFDDLDDAA